MEITQTIVMTLGSDHGEINAAISWLADQVTFSNLAAPDSEPFNKFHVRLALDEAMLNAVEHGCRAVPLAKIRVVARYSAHMLEFSIEDPGPGFVTEDLRMEDGRSVEHLMVRGAKNGKGWGLAIIRSLTHGLYWNARGNRVTMLFIR
ncbi:MAG TPA: ATP-binding protein [Candidatus Ozemobacteraceae bacterium]